MSCRTLEGFTSFETNAQTRDKGKCLLAADVLRSWGVLKLRAGGVSMLPTLWPGDLLTVRSHSPEHAEPGEIVLYRRRGRFFVHRIVSKNPAVDEAFLITRGDSMPAHDPPLRRGDLLGKITEVRRAGSVFIPARKVSRFNRILAYMFCHWGLFRRVGLRLWMSRHKSNRQSEGTLVNAAS